MTDENLTAQRRIDAPPRTVFALLADPANHAAIDGTGWVRGPHWGLFGVQRGVMVASRSQLGLPQ